MRQNHVDTQKDGTTHDAHSRKAPGTLVRTNTSHSDKADEDDYLDVTEMSFPQKTHAASEVRRYARAVTVEALAFPTVE